MTLRLEKNVNEKTFPDCVKCVIKQPKKGRLEFKKTLRNKRLQTSCNASKNTRLEIRIVIRHWNLLKSYARNGCAMDNLRLAFGRQNI